MFGDDFLVDKYNRFLPQYGQEDTLSLRAGGLSDTSELLERARLNTLAGLAQASRGLKAIISAESRMRAMWEVEPIG